MGLSSKLKGNLKFTENNEYASLVDIVYLQAKKVLAKAEIIFPHYTKHDIVHSERILERITEILDCHCPEKWEDEEKCILICAVLLHDIGMCTTKYIGDKDVEKLSEEDRSKIREQHHISSSDLIHESIDLSTDNPYYLGLNSKKELAPAIALVAKSHGDESLLEIESSHFFGKRVRLDLLCALMRLGDLLDIDQRRIDDIDLLKLISIIDTSKIHWYNHLYVSGVSIINLKISLYFNFHSNFKSENSKTADILKDRLKDNIVKQINHDKLTWYKYGFVWDENIGLDPQYLGAFKMPDEVIRFIEESQKVQNAIYQNDKGLGEIEFYWGGNRQTANEKIIEYIIEKDLNEIFIAAIGFGTISSVLKNDEVQQKIQEGVLNDNIKITFVLPGGIRDLLNFRQDIDEAALIKSYQEGQERLSDFINNIAKKCFQEETEEKRLEKISKYIEIKQYSQYEGEGSVPRHFILYGSDDTIFFGAYLSHTTGKKSYIMKLTPKVETEDDDKLNKGLFNLFKEEIRHIRENSKANPNIINKLKNK